jgi:hypothetical protein
MITTKEEALARQFDRFITDVNAVYKRLRIEVPGLKKSKKFDPDLGTTTYIFWYMVGDEKIFIS